MVVPLFVGSILFDAIKSCHRQPRPSISFVLRLYSRFRVSPCLSVANHLRKESVSNISQHVLSVFWMTRWMFFAFTCYQFKIFFVPLRDILFMFRMFKEFRSLGVFAAYSRWSLDNSSFGWMEHDKVSSKLLNSQTPKLQRTSKLEIVELLYK